MVHDDTAPATKKDIALLMEEIGKLYDANQRWKDEIIDQVDVRIEKWQDELRRYFEVRFEQMRRDIVGAFHDKTVTIDARLDNHESRIVTLEMKTAA